MAKKEQSMFLAEAENQDLGQISSRFKLLTSSVERKPSVPERSRNPFFYETNNEPEIELENPEFLLANNASRTTNNNPFITYNEPKESSKNFICYGYTKHRPRFAPRVETSERSDRSESAHEPAPAPTPKKKQPAPAPKKKQPAPEPKKKHPAPEPKKRQPAQEPKKKEPVELEKRFETELQSTTTQTDLRKSRSIMIFPVKKDIEVVHPNLFERIAQKFVCFAAVLFSTIGVLAFVYYTMIDEPTIMKLKQIYELLNNWNVPKKVPPKSFFTKVKEFVLNSVGQ